MPSTIEEFIQSLFPNTTLTRDAVFFIQKLISFHTDDNLKILYEKNFEKSKTFHVRNENIVLLAHKKGDLNISDGNWRHITSHHTIAINRISKQSALSLPNIEKQLFDKYFNSDIVRYVYFITTIKEVFIDHITSTKKLTVGGLWLAIFQNPGAELLRLAIKDDEEFGYRAQISDVLLSLISRHTREGKDRNKARCLCKYIQSGIYFKFSILSSLWNDIFFKRFLPMKNYDALIEIYNGINNTPFSFQRMKNIRVIPSSKDYFLIGKTKSDRLSSTTVADLISKGYIYDDKSYYDNVYKYGAVSYEELERLVRAYSPGTYYLGTFQDENQKWMIDEYGFFIVDPAEKSLVENENKHGGERILYRYFDEARILPFVDEKDISDTKLFISSLDPSDSSSFTQSANNGVLFSYDECYLHLNDKKIVDSLHTLGCIYKGEDEYFSRVVKKKKISVTELLEIYSINIENKKTIDSKNSIYYVDNYGLYITPLQKIKTPYRITTRKLYFRTGIYFKVYIYRTKDDEYVWNEKLYANPVATFIIKDLPCSFYFYFSLSNESYVKSHLFYDEKELKKHASSDDKIITAKYQKIIKDKEKKEEKEKKKDDRVDRVKGMFMGVMLGDALGAPHEMRKSKNKYTGTLQYEWIGGGRWNSKTYAVGSFTDDSEMTIALIRSIIDKKTVDRNSLIAEYVTWAQSLPAMGNHSRGLFQCTKSSKKEKKVSAYEKRYNEGYLDRKKERIFGTPESKEQMQSNGALMRATPLALFINKFEIDAKISNPSSVCIDAEKIYLTFLSRAIKGEIPDDNMWKDVTSLAETVEVKECIHDVEEGKDRDLIKSKGWVVHCLYVALWCLKYMGGKTFKTCMDWVVGSHPGGDVDTLGAVAGGLCGAFMGYEMMNSETTTNKNIRQIYKWCSEDETRPEKYKINNEEELSSLVVDLIQCHKNENMT